jgi:hypothetical protein
MHSSSLEEKEMHVWRFNPPSPHTIAPYTLFISRDCKQLSKRELINHAVAPLHLVVIVTPLAQRINPIFAEALVVATLVTRFVFIFTLLSVSLALQLKSRTHLH